MTEIQCRAALKNVPVYKAGKSVIEGCENPTKISSNENAYGASPRAEQAYKEALSELFKYPNGEAAILKDALAEFYNIDRDHIMCGAGSDNLLELFCICFLNDGDEAIFSTHSFPVYDIATRVAGGVPVKIPYKNNMGHDIDAIIDAASSSKTKIIFIANPDNPTGLHVPFSELERLVTSVPKHILIVIDEAYYEFATAEDYRTALPLVDKYSNVAVTRTFSKMFGLAALRVGWGYLPDVACDALGRARSPFNVSIPAQYAAAASIQDKAWQEDNLKKNLEQRERLEEFLKAHNFDYAPSQANFVFVHFKDAFAADKHLKDNGVIVRHMTGNGLPNYLRFSLGTPEQMDHLISALKTLPNDIK